ncbi:uncharacterized protein BDW43DRAFT_316609 [Aspergillus alliaceus]|uniref:uncharacterized protein n=1 Tax=Petromyces alliaceus TaxID=209559 RepID=UPI0012A7289E|nr:uncharacterized protein BDW43DRAFT_316609 [Aspergillus alliaceus]KAB8227707.1 hypothetical protein BDW43DRAFT_316609 [Aspergillus alliaceus]
MSGGFIVKREDDDVNRTIRKPASRVSRRTLTSAVTKSRNDVFHPLPDSDLDSQSSTFDTRAWVKALVRYESEHLESGRRRKSGASFRNLDLYGFGMPTDYQKSVGNSILLLLTQWCKKWIDILHDLKGLVNASEMLLVPGPPGSGLGRSVTIVGVLYQRRTIRRPDFAPSERRLSNRVDVTVQDIRDGDTKPLAWKTAPENTGDIGVIIPLTDQDRSNKVDDGNAIVRVISCGFGHIITVFPQSDVVAIALISIYTKRAFSCVGIREDERYAGWTGSRSNLVETPTVSHGERTAPALKDFILNRLLRSHEVWKVRSTTTLAHGKGAVIAPMVITAGSTPCVGARIVSQKSD